MEGPQPVHPEAQARPDADHSAESFLPAHRGGLDHRRLCVSRQAAQGTRRRLYLRRLGNAARLGHALRRRQSRAGIARLVDFGPRIVAFGESHDGELCILDYDLGTIHELQPNPDSRPANAVSHEAQRDRFVRTGKRRPFAGFPAAQSELPAARPGRRAVFDRCRAMGRPCHGRAIRRPAGAVEHRSASRRRCRSKARCSAGNSCFQKTACW